MKTTALFHLGCRCVASLSLLAFAFLARPAAGADAPPPKTIKIVLIGDSTVNDQGGWGAGFAKHVRSGAASVNWAQNGRSSKSFTDEGWWKKALAEKPDYVLIQFGHNDQPGKGPARETDPATTFPQNLARYVDEARAAGAKPVLVTSLARRNYRDGKIESTLTPYAEATKKVAGEKNVPLIDLHARSIELLDRIGPEAAAAFDAKPRAGGAAKATTKPAGKETPAARDGGPPATVPATPDRTHLSREGQAVFGKMVAEELKKAVPELAAHIE